MEGAEGDRRLPQILNYVRETAAENGIDKKSASSSGQAGRGRRRTRVEPWRTSAQGEGGGCEIVRFTCISVHVSGYYKLRKAISRSSPAKEIQPIVPRRNGLKTSTMPAAVRVIGSGATAGELVPDGQTRARHHACSVRRPMSCRARRRTRCQQIAGNLPARLAYHLIRWRNVMWGMYSPAQPRKPAQGQQLILAA